MNLTKENLDDFSDAVFLLNKFVREADTLNDEVKISIRGLVKYLGIIEQLLNEKDANEKI